MKYTSALFLYLLLNLNVVQSASLSDSISISITEEASDSIGPWSRTFQNIDSLKSSGQITARTKRLWNGTDWQNERYEKYDFNMAGLIINQWTYLWNGSNFENYLQKEISYFSNNLVNTETNYQFIQNFWQAYNRQVHYYSQQNQDSLIIHSNFINGSWTDVKKILLNYNADNQITEETEFDWTGATWEPVLQKRYAYSALTLKLRNDTTFNYTLSQFVPSACTEYIYDNSGNTLSVIKQNFYSFQYSDQDTSYLVTDIESEYTTRKIYNSQNLILEIHTVQSRGSNQTSVFEHSYFTYDQSERLTASFSHLGSNLNDTYRRHTNYFFNPLLAEFNINETSCASCNDGSVNVTSTGGIPPFNLNISPISGTINGMNITNLNAGTYTVCVQDALANEVCNTITITGILSGIKNSASGNPDPAVRPDRDSRQLIVVSNNNEIESIFIYDVCGKLILSKSLQSDLSMIPFYQATRGIYFYQLCGTKQNYSGRIQWTGNEY